MNIENIVIITIEHLQMSQNSALHNPFGDMALNT